MIAIAIPGFRALGGKTLLSVHVSMRQGMQLECVFTTLYFGILA